jgi:hypothetical protein
MALHELTSFQRTTARIVIVLLSILLPAIFVVWSVVMVLSDKPLGRTSNSYKKYHEYDTSIRNGELWFVAETFSENPFRMTSVFRIMRLNLTTGAESETGLVTKKKPITSFWINDAFYVLTNTEVFKAIGNSLEQIGLLPEPSRTFFPMPFGMDGNVTSVIESSEGFRLSHLIDHRWVDGPGILLPGSHRIWYFDQERQRMRLLPLTSQQPAKSSRQINAFGIGAIQFDQQVHIFCFYGGGTIAYRKGFEFVDPARVTCSALAPENFAQEVSEWKLLGPNSADESERQIDGSNFAQVIYDQDGLLLISPSCLVRRTLDGRIVKLDGFNTTSLLGPPNLTQDQVNEQVYLVHSNPQWNIADFHRIEGNVVRPASLKLAGCVSEYVGRWKILAAGILFAWVAHFLLAIAGASYYTSRAGDGTYSFGKRNAVLASPIRRSLAFAVDLGLLIGVLIFASSIQACFSNRVRPPIGDAMLAKLLFDIEAGIKSEIQTWDFPLGMSNVLSQAFRVTNLLLRHKLVFVDVVVPLFFVMWCLRLYGEVRYGTTPGKWLLGIKTLESTLRPCTISRLIVRDTMICIDVMFLLSPVPAMIGMMESERRQRFGDRIADTVVVKV